MAPRQQRGALEQNTSNCVTATIADSSSPCPCDVSERLMTAEQVRALFASPSWAQYQRSVSHA